MAVNHSLNLVITGDVLREVADARLREAQSLIGAEQWVGGMFLGRCALECYLKLAICRTLKLDGLPAVFKIHDLETLVLYTGLQRDLQKNEAVKKSLDSILKEWGTDGRAELLYRDPKEIGEVRATSFLESLSNPDAGVIPWLLSLTS